MTKHYNLSNIRTLLTKGFTDKELRRFCYDKSDFRPVYDQLADNTGKNEIIDRLLEYADQKCLIDKLLKWAKARNLNRYEKHQPYYDDAIGMTDTPPTRPSFEPEMILIPTGEFLMGSDPEKDKNAQDKEQPQHTLYLPNYYLAKTAVTKAQYAAFVQKTGHKPPQHWVGELPPQGKENHPVVFVSWHDAMAYCRWLAEVTGRNYTLPSEAEWEKGARSDDGRIYPWGNQWDAKRCNSSEDGKRDTTPVDVYPGGASPYGLLDMVGNVWEWTRSLWGRDNQKPDFEYPYQLADGREDEAADDTMRRVLRGGSFDNNKEVIRCAYRAVNNIPKECGNVIGFRVVRF